jgi:DNA mismatch repair protein MutL
MKTITCLALAAPHVSFRLLLDGRCAIDVKEDVSSPLLSRIRALLKEPFQNNAFEVRHVREGFSLTGLIADPRQARSTRSGQYLIVNGRSVHSLPISYAVKNAFGTTCDDGKHPLFALHLDLDPSSIDVNVHPQKREVRFADEEWVRMLVQESVSEALFGKRGFLPSADVELPESLPSSLKEPSEDSFSLWQTSHVDDTPSLPLCIPNPSRQESSALCIAVIGDVALIKPPQGREDSFPVPYDSLLILDLKQAMRAVTFQDLQSPSEPLMTELLFVPIVVECSVQEASLVAVHIPYFEKLGFMIHSVGPQSFLIEGAPKPFLELDLSKFIVDVCYEGVLTSVDQASDLRNKRLATSIVASMKAMRPPVDSATATSVLSSWSRCGFPAFAPDGSPCYSQVTPGSLKEWVAKGMAPTIKIKRGTQ